MRQIGEKVMVFARIEKIIQDKNGVSYMVIPDDNEDIHYERMVVHEDCVRDSDDEILKKMEVEHEFNQKQEETCLQKQ